MRRLPLIWGLWALAACAVGVEEAEAPIVQFASDEADPLPEAEEPEASAPRLATTRAACDAAKVAEVLAPATAEARAVSVSCGLTLRPSDVVTKQIILEGSAASGVTVACNGALIDGREGSVNDGRDMIEIRARKTTPGGVATWDRPEDITIRDCRITGSLRVWGMGKNGEAADVRASSRQADHTTRARAAAPRRIILDNLTITGVGRTPLYLSPGVTYVTLTNSEIDGDATSVGVYLDTESARNTLRNNYFHVTSRKDYAGGLYTRKREEIALDNSSYNKIIDNRLSSLEGGGIFLYRNCGEGGTVRHATPSYNQIINNVFYYDAYDGDNPAIYLGSRDNDFWEFRWYCDDDEGFPWGSSADDRSFARYNVVMQNQIYKRSLSDMIQQGDDSNQPNYLGANATVASESMRRAGCYVASGYKTFILDGETIDVLRGSGGAPVCSGTTWACDDGELRAAGSSACSLTRVVSDCQVEGRDAGCSKVAACPAGRRIVAAAAACNLEYGTVSEAQLAAVPVGSIGVVRASDSVADGRCFVGGARASSGRAAITGVVDASKVSIGCSEKDKNGGDCHIKAALTCR